MQIKNNRLINLYACAKETLLRCYIALLIHIAFYAGIVECQKIIIELSDD